MNSTDLCTSLCQGVFGNNTLTASGDESTAAPEWEFFTTNIAIPVVTIAGHVMVYKVFPWATQRANQLWTWGSETLWGTHRDFDQFIDLTVSDTRINRALKNFERLLYERVQKEKKNASPSLKSSYQVQLPNEDLDIFSLETPSMLVMFQQITDEDLEEDKDDEAVVVTQSSKVLKYLNDIFIEKAGLSHSVARQSFQDVLKRGVQENTIKLSLKKEKQYDAVDIDIGYLMHRASSKEEKKEFTFEPSMRVTMQFMKWKGKGEKREDDLEEGND